MDRSDTVLPPGAVQTFVRGLSRLQLGNDDKVQLGEENKVQFGNNDKVRFETSRNSRLGDDNDDKSQGVEVGRLDAMNGSGRNMSLLLLNQETLCQRKVQPQISILQAQIKLMDSLKEIHTPGKRTL